jgi:hypothetical protein
MCLNGRNRKLEILIVVDKVQGVVREGEVRMAIIREEAQ